MCAGYSPMISTGEWIEEIPYGFVGWKSTLNLPENQRITAFNKQHGWTSKLFLIIAFFIIT